ncbi:MAG: flagellar basal body P-ring formation protein FlgA [Hydrogenophilales bacterium]|nr:flagellar basal body P-ring formation protein FlgA [Hydrogenophilales bacterium]
MILGSRFTLGCLLGLFCLPPVLAAQQDIALIRQTAETYAKQQTAHLPGQVTVTLGAIEPVQFASCAKLQAFLPLGAKLWGNSTVGVRCAAGAEWSLYVPVTVRVQGPVVVAARSLASGKLLAAEDLALQTAELTQLPSGVVSDANDAAGKTLSVGVSAGHALRQDMLRAPLVIRQGQAVKLIAQGQGFKVSSEGRALANAAAGQTVQVKAQNGQTVSGVARADGSVEVQY